MKNGWCWIMVGLSLGLATAYSDSNDEPKDLRKPDRNAERTISNSNQFVLYGADKRTRNELANRCEEIRRDFSAVLRLPGQQWNYLIVVVLHDRDTSGIVCEVRPVVGKTFNLKIHVSYNGEIDGEEFDSAVVRMLLYEQMYTPWNDKFSRKYIPPWMLAGIEKLIEFRRAGRPSGIYESIIESQQILSIGEVMNTNPQLLHDTVSRQVYEACSAALVQAIFNQPKGHESFLALLRDLAVDDSKDLALVQRHFKTFRQGEKALAKWWALQMALMSQRSIFELLSMEETEQYLEQALRVNLAHFPLPNVEEEKGRFPSLPGFGGGKNKDDEFEFTLGTLRDFDQFMDDPRAKNALQQNLEQLARLQNQVFPLHQIVLAEYIAMVTRLLEGDTKGVKEKLNKLDQRRAQIRELMTGVDDYMNWYTVTQMKEETDEFLGYEEALKRLERLDSRKRTDPITQYLDDVEAEVTP